MYLPLTGYKEKDSFEEKMSINSISAPDPSIVQPLSKSQKTQQETRKVEQVQTKQTQEAQGLTEEQKKTVFIPMIL